MNALKGYAKTGSIRGAAEYAGLSTPAAGRLLAGTKQRLPVLQVELELFDFFNEARTTTDRNLAWMRTAMEGAELNARIAESASQESQAVAKSLRIDLDVLRTTLPKLNEQREHLAVQLEKVNRFAEMQRQGVEQLAAHHRELQELIAPLAMALQRLLPEIQAYTGAAEALSSWVVQRLGAESLPEVMLLKAKRDAVIQAAGGLLPLLPRFLRLAGIMPEE